QARAIPYRNRRRSAAARSLRLSVLRGEERDLRDRRGAQGYQGQGDRRSLVAADRERGALEIPGKVRDAGTCVQRTSAPHVFRPHGHEAAQALITRLLVCIVRKPS